MQSWDVLQYPVGQEIQAWKVSGEILTAKKIQGRSTMAHG